jgi:hypothetical protein
LAGVAPAAGGSSVSDVLTMRELSDDEAAALLRSND